jgi:hypothetical protein
MINELFPAISAVDSWLALSLPLIFRISFFGVLAGVLAMVVYALISNQKAISNLKLQARELRSQMLDPSQEEYSVFLSLAKKNILVSLKLLGIVMGPVLLAALPVLVLAAWIDSHHGYSIPAMNKAVEMGVIPANSKITANPSDLVNKKGNSIFISPPINTSNPISLFFENQLVFQGRIFSKPTPYLIKEKWWHSIFASDIGYISQTSPVEEIYFAFPKKTMHDSLPDWASGWEWTYFISILIISIPIKFIFKIE